MDPAVQLTASIARLPSSMPILLYKFSVASHHLQQRISPPICESFLFPLLFLWSFIFGIMADSNAPEHQDRGLFGLFGKKKEDETHQQHPTAVDPHGHGHVGDVHHAAPPPPVSHGHVEEHKHQGECEGEKKPHEGGLMGKLHRSNSSSSSSSSDEEGGEKGEKKKKKKGGLKEKLPGHKKEGEAHGEEKKEGFMDKIKEKLPGHHGKEEEKGH